MPTELTPAQRQALIELVIAAPGSITVLYDALACSLAVRDANTTWGDLMIEALMLNGESRREIARRISELTGRNISESTIRGWGKRAGAAPDAGDEQ